MRPTMIRLIEDCIAAGLEPIEIAATLATTDYEISYLIGFIDCLSGHYEQQRPTLRLVQDGDT